LNLSPIFLSAYGAFYWRYLRVNLAEALEAKSNHCGFCRKNWALRDARKEYDFAVIDTRATLNLRKDAEAYYISGRA